MSEMPKSHAEIIAQMRDSANDTICPRWAEGGGCDRCPMGGAGKNCPFDKFADQLDAAHKRELDAKDSVIQTLSSELQQMQEKREITIAAQKEKAASEGYADGKRDAQVGNAAKLREALDEILEKIDKWRTDGTMEHWQYSQLFDIADAALAGPARNCDVGTLEERREQFEQFCKSHSSVVVCNRDCPLYNLHTKGYSCHFEWGELPNESGAKA